MKPWIANNSNISNYAIRISYETLCVSYVASRVSYVALRVSYVASRVSYVGPMFLISYVALRFTCFCGIMCFLCGITCYLCDITCAPMLYHVFLMWMPRVSHVASRVSYVALCIVCSLC